MTKGTGKRMHHTSPADYDAIDQMRARHEGFRTALVSARSRLKSNRKDETIEDRVIETINLITKALNADKAIG